MDKQVKGIMPPPANVTFKDYDPLNGTAPSAAHERDNIQSGNLRNHNGAICPLGPNAGGGKHS